MQTSPRHPLDDDRRNATPSARPGKEATAAATTRTRLSLRPLLIADAASCIALGAILVPFGRLLAGSTGLPPALLFEAGLVLLAFGAVLGWMARRPDVPASVGRFAAVGNAVWVAASGAVLLALRNEITVVGEVLVVAQAAAVGVLALLEWRSARGR